MLLDALGLNLRSAVLGTLRFSALTVEIGMRRSPQNHDMVDMVCLAKWCILFLLVLHQLKHGRSTSYTDEARL